MFFKITGFICIELLCYLCKHVAYVYNNTEENTFLPGRINDKGEKRVNGNSGKIYDNSMVVFMQLNGKQLF